jgi:hypothetical protein
MTYPDGDWLADLDPTDEERLAFLEVLDEQDAEDAGLPSPYDDEPGPPEGPWDDQAARLAAIGETVDDSYGQAAAVAAEDAEDAEWLATRPSDEAKIANAIRRAEAGTYQPPAMFRPARDTGGRYASACGPVDPDFGHCTSRYHESGCGAAVATSAATGDAGAVEAWNDTITSHPTALDVIAAEQQLGLATPSQPEPWDGTDQWGGLLGPEGGPGSADPRLHARMLNLLGEADQLPPPPRPDLPDVSSIRSVLGL